MGTDICFPVAKYSSAAGLRADNSVAWNHLTSSNLFIILKGTDQMGKDDQLMLRIVQGNQVLESIDIGAYVDSALALKRSAQNRGEAIYMQQLPIFGRVQDTILALRYITEGTVACTSPTDYTCVGTNVWQTRRLQVRMHSASECRQLSHAFEARGMEIMQQPTAAARPDTARPLTMCSQLVAPQSTSTSLRPPSSITHPFTPRVVEAGSLSHSRPRSSEQSAANVHDQPQQTSTDPQMMPPPSLITRNETSAPREVAPARPSTAFLYRSHSSQRPAPQTGTDDLLVKHFTSTPESFPAFDSTTATAAGSLLDHHATEESHPGEGGGASSKTLSDDRAAGTRPTTASSLVFVPTVEHEIPPRRELPFARPDSRRSGSTNSRPGSALSLPPLPKPRLSKQDSSTSGSDPAARPSSSARPQTSSPLKRSFAEDHLSSTTFDRPATASPQKSTSPTQVSSPQAPAKRPGPLDKLLNDRKHCLQNSASGKASASKVPRLDSLADAPGEIDEFYASNNPSPTKTLSQRDSMSPVRRPNAAQDHDRTVTAYAAVTSTAQSSGSSSLRRYAEQSLEDRQAALDEFMVQNLENADFVRLCKDVENCWKRIALGL